MAEAVFEASEEVKISAAAAAASQPGTGGRPGKALNFIEYNQENGKQRLGHWGSKRSDVRRSSAW